MQHGYAPEGGKRMTPHHYRVAKGVNGIINLLPIQGECWLRTIPKALPWADLSLAFQAVFTPTVYTPLPLAGVGDDVKPTQPSRREGVLCSFVLLSEIKG